MKPVTPPPEALRISVYHLMMLVGVVALVLGAAQGGYVGWVVCNLVLLSVVVRFVLLERLGPRCPGCGRRTLGRVAVVPFGGRYYRCSSCGERRKRSILGVWHAAKGPRDDAVFGRSRDEGRWVAAPASVDESGAQGHLLRGKRHREAHPDYEPAGDVPEGGLIVPGAVEATPTMPRDLASDPAVTPGRLLRVKRAASRRTGRGSPS